MKENRNSNIELLRIVCMCFIIAGHVIMKYSSDDLGTNEYYISNVLRSFFIVAVNCFVIISGYFGIKLNIRKLIKMNIQVVFYSIVIFLITIICGIHEVSIKKDILLLFPVITKRYWYITIYFVLCIISPLLNIIIEKLNRNQFKGMLITAISMFYILPIISYCINSPTITADAGYGIVNFICLYFIGRYIRLYYKDSKSKLFYGGGFILASLSLFLANHLLTLIFGFYFNSFLSYDTIFVLTSAYMLFMLFKNIQLKSNIINNLAKYSIVAYIIHMHPTFIDYLFNKIFNIQSYSGIGYIVIILIIPIIVYLISCLIEWIRVRLFNNIESKIIDNVLNNSFIEKYRLKL